MDYKAIARAITDPENQPHQWSDQELAKFFVSAANEIERLREAYLAIEKQLGETQVRCSEIGERLLGEIERLREALKKIINPDNFENIFEIAEAALQQKESE